MTEQTNYLCDFYSEQLEKYSEINMQFLPRVGDVIENSGYMYQVILVEYGFNSGAYNIYTKALDRTSEHETVIRSLFAQKM